MYKFKTFALDVVQRLQPLFSLGVAIALSYVQI